MFSNHVGKTDLCPLGVKLLHSDQLPAGRVCVLDVCVRVPFLTITFIL